MAIKQAAMDVSLPQARTLRLTRCSAPRLAPTKAAKPTVATFVDLQSELVTNKAFEPFGQLIGPTDDGKEFDASDAQLVLNNGTPRFYIMRLPRRGLQFSRITYHSSCTQCLGGLQSSTGIRPWYIVVAAPTGSVSEYPQQHQLKAFKIPHGVFIKFKEGTWHAGPLFDSDDFMDFYNLELADTNIIDHNTHDYSISNGITYRVLEC